MSKYRYEKIGETTYYRDDNINEIQNMFIYIDKENNEK